MATTTSRKSKVSFFSILSLVMTVLPIVIEFINRGEPKASIDFSFDSRTQRLRAVVSTPDEDGSVSRSTLVKE